MTTIRTCITISQLFKHSIRVVHLRKLHYAHFHQNRILVATHECFVNQKRNLFKSNHRNKDDEEEGRIRVYEGLLTTQIRTVKLFSLTTSVCGLIAQPMLYKQLSALESMPLLIAGCSFLGFFTFVTPFLLHFITKKYVTQLDYNHHKDTYIAKTVNFFCMQKETEFKVDDVNVPDLPGMFTTFHAKGKALFLEARLFEDPSHYARIMGYDKPLDFKLYDTSSSNSDESSMKKE